VRSTITPRIRIVTKRIGMSTLSARFLEHSGKDEFGNLVLLFEDKKIKMAFSERGEPLLACKDIARACGATLSKKNQIAYRGEHSMISFKHNNQNIIAKFVGPPGAVRMTKSRRTPEAIRFWSFLVDTIGIPLPQAMRATSELPRRPNVCFRAMPGNPSYCAGDNGSIWSKRSGAWRQLKQYVDKDGYLSVAFSSEVEKVGEFNFKDRMTVHRLVLLAFKGEPEAGQMSCHNNGIKADNSPGNLRWGTAKDNSSDTIKHQALLTQEPSRGGKLNEEMVKEIRSLRSSNVPVSAIANRFRISKALTYKVANGMAWKDVE
jgi:hypothetical protein